MATPVIPAVRYNVRVVKGAGHDCPIRTIFYGAWIEATREGMSPVVRRADGTRIGWLPARFRHVPAAGALNGRKLNLAFSGSRTIRVEFTEIPA